MTTAPPTPAAPSRPAQLRSRLASTTPIYAVLALLFVLIALETPSFFEPQPFLVFLKRASPLVVLAVGQYLVIVSGEYDLSVGALVTATVVVAARLSDGIPGRTVPLLALLIGLGLLVGLVNGLVTTRLRVPSFITTLGMLLVLNGTVFLWSSGAPRGALAQNFRSLGRQGLEVPGLGQVPYAVMLSVVLVVIAAVAMRSGFGRQLIAVGDNDRAAALSGVRVERMRIIAFVVSGACAALAGILLGGFAGVTAQAGAGLEFEAITAVVLGGVVLGGGRGSVLAAVAGALSLKALFTLLNLKGVSGALEDSVQGLILIAAVAYAARRASVSR